MAGLNKVTVDDIDVKGKKVLVRVDFNVPMKDGVITNDNRIQAALPTIQKLVSEGGKVILCSHLGKPKNGPEAKFSLKAAAERLAELVAPTKVTFVPSDKVVDDSVKAAVDAMQDGEIIVLENTRFRGAEETKNGEEFSKELASLADVFVMDAFGSAHRAHASTAGVTKFVKTTAVGYLMQKEIQFLGNAVEDPVRPFVAILGGAKVADKLNVISNLLEKCDTLIIGGGMAYTFLKAEGYEVGTSLVDDTKLDYCKEMIEKAEKLEEDTYTETSWTVLQTRLADAKDALEETKQTAVDKAVEKLKTAIAQLESKDGKDEENTKYISGTYEVTVPCTPDEDEDFEEYELTMSVVIRNDKIVSITDITGNGASSNDDYIKRAANGTSSIKGVVSQIIDKGMPEDIDTVSRATCSSNAILEGCKKVLEAAERPTDMEAE